MNKHLEEEWNEHLRKLAERNEKERQELIKDLGGQNEKHKERISGQIP